MAIQNVLSISIPDAGVADDFTNGEVALAVHSPYTQTPIGTYFLSRRINLPAGTYTISINGAGAGSVWIGEDLSTLRRLAAYGSTQGGPVQSDFYVQGGTLRLEAVLSVVANPPPGFVGPVVTGSAYVVINIKRAGRTVYASTAADWQWDTAFIPDSSLLGGSDPRLDLPVFTITPNWRNGVTETFGWASDVFTSETDREQRRSLLANPKRMFEAQFMRSNVERMRLNDLLGGLGSGEIVVPFWPEQVKLAIDVPQGSTVASFPPGTLTNREFVVGGLAVLTSRDVNRHDLMVIQQIEQTPTYDRITFTRTTQHAWSAGCRITPGYVCRIESSSSLTQRTDRAAVMTIRFKQRETLKFLQPSWGYCAPLWQFRLEAKDNLQSTFNRLTYELSNGIAPDEEFDFGDTTRVMVRGGLVLYGRNALWAYRNFLAMARGRVARFWWPSQSHDIEPLAESFGGLFFDAKTTGLVESMPVPQDARTMLGFYPTDGSRATFRRIANIENVSADVQRFHLTQPLPPMLRRNLVRISYVLPVRFEQDNFELFHVTDNAKAVKAAVVVRSTEIDGLPDIECSITSWTYPLDALDAIECTGGFLGGTMWSGPVDEMQVSATLVSANLQSTLTAHSQPHEDSLDLASTFLSGTLQSTLASHSQPHEDSLDVSGTLVAGNLQNALITVQRYDIDEIDVAGNFIGATLS